MTHVYNPLDYAWPTHPQYLELYGQGTKEMLLLGMNPGPWGMAQTGVPFGEVAAVRDWLGISGEIGRPDDEHPKRQVVGLACTRSEVSGARLWGWARESFRHPRALFRALLHRQLLSLGFRGTSGRNRTPDKLPAKERAPLLRDLRPRAEAHGRAPEAMVVIGVGAFAEGRAVTALDGIDVAIGRILHPSPASPAANRGWAEQATRELRELGVDLP